MKLWEALDVVVYECEEEKVSPWWRGWYSTK